MTLKPLSHEELIAKMMADSKVSAEVARLNREEYVPLDQGLAARDGANGDLLRRD